MSKHTPGPWSMREDKLGNGFIYSEGKTLSLCAVPSIANAARIVECVNACEPGGVIEQALSEAAEWLADEITPSGDIPEGLPQIQRKIREALAALGVK